MMVFTVCVNGIAHLLYIDWFCGKAACGELYLL